MVGVHRLRPRRREVDSDEVPAADSAVPVPEGSVGTAVPEDSEGTVALEVLAAHIDGSRSRIA